MQERSHDLPPSLCRCDSDGTNSQLCACDSPLHLFQLLAVSCALRQSSLLKCHVGGPGLVPQRATRERILKAASCSADDQHFSFSQCIPQFFFYHSSPPPTSSFRAWLGSEFMQGGHTSPCFSQDPPGDKLSGSPVRDGVYLDIKHQAATSAGLMKTSQLPVICLTAERRSRKIKPLSKCLSRAFKKRLIFTRNAGVLSSRRSSELQSSQAEGWGGGERNSEQVCTRWAAAIQLQISSFSGATSSGGEGGQGGGRKEGGWSWDWRRSEQLQDFPPPHCQWFICRRPPINRFLPLIYYWRLLCRMRGFPLADSIAKPVDRSFAAQNLNFWQIDKLVLEPWCHSGLSPSKSLRKMKTCFIYFFLLNPFLSHPCARCTNCAAYQMKWSTSGGLALSGNSTEQTERGIQLKCWKTFRKEGDVIPPVGRGRHRFLQAAVLPR